MTVIRVGRRPVILLNCVADSEAVGARFYYKVPEQKPKSVGCSVLTQKGENEKLLQLVKYCNKFCLRFVSNVYAE